MTTTEIRQRIDELEAQKARPHSHPTEIYTRIVGYYRSLTNWNAGKREEYSHRVTFDPAASTAPRAHAKARRWVVFVKDTCPRCPAMKAKLPLLPFAGQTFDVDTAQGFEAAGEHQVMVTPTLILQDDAGRELLRVTDAADWARVDAIL